MSGPGNDDRFSTSEAVIRVLRGPNAGHENVFSRGKTFLIGRSHVVDLNINDPAVAMQHCRVDWDEKEGMWITPLVDDNRVYLNEVHMEARTQLIPRDVIRLGTCEIQFMDPRGTSHARRPPRPLPRANPNDAAAAVALTTPGPEDTVQSMRIDGEPIVPQLPIVAQIPQSLEQYLGASWPMSARDAIQSLRLLFRELDPQLEALAAEDLGPYTPEDDNTPDPDRRGPGRRAEDKARYAAFEAILRLRHLFREVDPYLEVADESIARELEHERLSHARTAAELEALKRYVVELEQKASHTIELYRSEIDHLSKEVDALQAAAVRPRRDVGAEATSQPDAFGAQPASPTDATAESDHERGVQHAIPTQTGNTNRE